jgi:hypothetical protein
MQVLYERCCGRDVYKKTVVACVVITALAGQAHKQVRTFAPPPPVCSLWQIG